MKWLLFYSPLSCDNSIVSITMDFEFPEAENTMFVVV